MPCCAVRMPGCASSACAGRVRRGEWRVRLTSAQPAPRSGLAAACWTRQGAPLPALGPHLQQGGRLDLQAGGTAQARFQHRRREAVGRQDRRQCLGRGGGDGPDGLHKGQGRLQGRGGGGEWWSREQLYPAGCSTPRCALCSAAQAACCERGGCACIRGVASASQVPAIPASETASSSWVRRSSLGLHGREGEARVALMSRGVGKRLREACCYYLLTHRGLEGHCAPRAPSVTHSVTWWRAGRRPARASALKNRRASRCRSSTSLSRPRCRAGEAALMRERPGRRKGGPRRRVARLRRAAGAGRAAGRRVSLAHHVEALHGQLGLWGLGRQPLALWGGRVGAGVSLGTGCLPGGTEGRSTSSEAQPWRVQAAGTLPRPLATLLAPLPRACGPWWTLLPLSDAVVSRRRQELGRSAAPMASKTSNRACICRGRRPPGPAHAPVCCAAAFRHFALIVAAQKRWQGGRALLEGPDLASAGGDGRSWQPHAGDACLSICAEAPLHRVRAPPRAKNPDGFARARVPAVWRRQQQRY